MAYEIIIKKRFTNKLLGVLDYLGNEWGSKVSHQFLYKVRMRISAVQSHPYIGASTSKHNHLLFGLCNSQYMGRHFNSPPIV